MKTALLTIAAAGLSCAPLAAQGRGKQAARPLPDGPGKTILENSCTSCHPASMITNTGHTAEDWRLVMERMIAAGADVPTNQVTPVVDYLAKNFPEGDVPKAVIIPGPVKISFKEFKVPTVGARPHDPLSTRDGFLWYTGQYGNVLGRVNTKTGEIKEFHPPTPRSGPHGFAEDKDGKIWFTANSKGYVGTLDPKTGEFSEHKLPPDVRDPHTPIFDRDGIYWFTAQNSNKIARLDPKSGDVKVVDSPTPRSNPYGMVLDSKNNPWYCEFNAPKIARVDSKTMAIQEFTLPNPESRPRRIAITDDDMIYYADYSRGYLGRLNTTTGEVKEWPSPGGPRSQPYGIAFLDGIIWYSEAAVKPNTMVRFDPKTEKFQTWAIPAGGGVVRNMATTKDGNLVIAESALNIVAVVEIGK
ncbi:MAG: cytochrome C [Bryobacteraceae bacterium]